MHDNVRLYNHCNFIVIQLALKEKIAKRNCISGVLAVCLCLVGLSLYTWFVFTANYRFCKYESNHACRKSMVQLDESSEGTLEK